LPRRQTKPKKESNEQTVYDYFHGNKQKLSVDGKKVHVVLIKGLSDYTLQEMGKLGFLIGEALKDYKEQYGQ
jgi:hypothetical protein